MSSFLQKHMRSHHEAAEPDLLRLRSGVTLAVRLVEAGDADALQDYFRSLSLPSRHSRFLGALSELPRSELEHFVHAGEDGRYSIVATAWTDAGETIVGEARFGVVDDVLEFGLSVDDRWQGQGVGSALLQNLECRAAVLGASISFGETLRGNAAMIALAHKSGYRAAAAPSDWRLVRFHKSLDVATQHAPCTGWRLTDTAHQAVH